MDSNNQSQQPQQQPTSSQQQPQRLPPSPMKSSSPRRISNLSPGSGGGGRNYTSSSAAVRQELELDLNTSTAIASAKAPSKWSHSGFRSTGTSPSPLGRRSLEFAQIAAAATASRQRRPVLSNQISTASTLSAASAASAGQSRGAATGAMNVSLAMQAPLTQKIDNRAAIIIEIGTRLTKIGFAGEFIPQHIFRTEWFDPMDGPDAPQPKQVFDKNRNEQEQYEILVKFLKNIVFRKLLTTISSRRVVLVESLLTPTWQRQALAHALFDCASLSPHSILFAPSHLLCSFPFNARTCLVLDLGADEAVLFPIAEGVLMLSSWETSSVGCATALEQNVKRLVCQYGRVVKCMNNKISNEEEREIKEEKREAEGDETDENKEQSSSFSMDSPTGRPLNDRDLALADSMRVWEDLVVRFCFVTTAQRGRRLQAHLANPQSCPFDQPAPSIHLQFGAELLYVPGIVREATAELMFMHNDEMDTRSIPQILLDCIAKVPLDLRRELLGNMLIVGGVTRLPGFLARLKTELLNLIADGYQHLAPTLTDLKFYQFPKEIAGQLFCSWLGGALFGALDDTLELRSLTRLQWKKAHRVPDWTDPIDAPYCRFDTIKWG